MKKFKKNIGTLVDKDFVKGLIVGLFFPISLVIMLFYIFCVWIFGGKK